jgi:putative FmdB family regulatory protein
MITTMPIYDFKCRACGRKFEELVKLGETPDCPACKGKDVERLFSLSAAVSTDKTRKRSLGQARRAAGKVNREKKHAQAEYERHYIKDHSDHG